MTVLLIVCGVIGFGNSVAGLLLDDEALFTTGAGCVAFVAAAVVTLHVFG